MFTHRSPPFPDLDRQALAVSGLRIQRCHPAARPSKNRFELRDRRAAVRRPGRRNFADAVCGARNTGRSAGIAEQVAEAFLSQRLAALARDEGQIPAGASGERLGKNRQDRQCDRDRAAALFGLMEPMPLRTCWRPKRTASPRRSPV
jgi:hypothetical protein